MKKNIIICWYGTFENSGTVGDLLAISQLTNYLKNQHNICCISAKKFDDLHCEVYTPDYLTLENISKYDIMIFCCGPIIKNHNEFISLIKKFDNVYKIGISISLFDKIHFNYINPFNFVLARQGNLIDYEDIAILSSLNNTTNNIINTKLTIGICLRGIQFEYGVENCLYNIVDNILEKLFILLDNNKIEYTKIILNNHLYTSGIEPKDIINLYRQCDIIITTRFHGCIISLQNNIPFIGIDHIVNGGKLQKLISNDEYKHIYNVVELNDKKLYDIIMNILDDKNFITYLENLKIHKNKKANTTLITLQNHIESLI